jgi:Lipocalin-like domain
MNRRAIIGLSAMAALGMSLLGGNTFGQQEPLAEQLLGTWTLVSHESVRQDGSRFPVYGATPKGMAFFDSGGHFIITVMRSDRAPNTQLISRRRVRPRKIKQRPKGR